MTPVNKRKGGRFQQGEVGNPTGRPKGSKNRQTRLTPNDAVQAAKLARKGLSPTAIAKVVSATPAAVKEALASARQILEAFAPEVAQHWVEAARIAAADGDHKPAMALLQSIEVVKPVAQTYDTGPGGKAVAAVKVEIHNFGFAGLPDPQPQQAIDVTATESKS
jgi:hypothetical protein